MIDFIRNIYSSEFFYLKILDNFEPKVFDIWKSPFSREGLTTIA